MHHARQLRCEYLDNPLGIADLQPRLSWQLDDPRPNARQTAYQIVAASTRELLATQPNLWDTGSIHSDQCLDVAYAGRRLRARQTVWWRVRVWDAAGQASAWSAPAFFEIGLLKRGDWTAQWIGRPLESKTGSQPCPYLRRAFALRGPVTRARIYVTARGLFELHLNGQRIGEDYFTPGWTDYHKRIQYLVYDVTGHLHAGPNDLRATLGDGWYAGYLCWENHHFLYGDQLSLLLQLEVEYGDGALEIIPSDASWETAFGPILQSDIYHGETYDARRAPTGWQPAVVFPAPKAALVALHSRPVRKQEELPALAHSEPTPHTYIFDLGQNMVGWSRVKVRAPAGTCITIRHGEMLNADGTLYTTNLRLAKCTDRYICHGRGAEVFEPHFTFHGFRYVELTGLVEPPALSDVTGIVLHTEMPVTGTFACSDPLVNRLQQNIVWSQKGNFFDIPTDCPQRDERLGWTGDAQVFIRTACFNRNVAPFFTKWSVDMADAQFKDGAYPNVVPDVVHDGSRGNAAWADAGVICPWTIYLCYGDKAILRRQYPAMTRWIEWQRQDSRQLIATARGFGDWLSVATTPMDLIATAYFAHSTGLVAKIASILGYQTDSQKYAKLARQIKAAFNREFVTPTGLVAGDSQTSYLLALGFDLLPERKRAAAVARLVVDLKRRNWLLSTGFVGTPLLAPVLTRFGQTDVAYRLLLQQMYPSWLFSVLQGATTMWERWNSYSKTDGFGDPGMNSFNHYAYGAIGEWLYNTVTGIELDPRQPGYKHILIRPQPGGGLTWARGELLTRYGKVRCAWKLEKRKLTVNVTIPANTTATVMLPGRKPRAVSAGTYVFKA